MLDNTFTIKTETIHYIAFETQPKLRCSIQYLQAKELRPLDKKEAQTNPGQPWD